MGTQESMNPLYRIYSTCVVSCCMPMLIFWKLSVTPVKLAKLKKEFYKVTPFKRLQEYHYRH